MKVQSDDELRKSPDKPFQVLMALCRTESRECVAAQVTVIAKLDLMPNISMIEKVVQQIWCLISLPCQQVYLYYSVCLNSEFLSDEDISQMRLLVAISVHTDLLLKKLLQQNATIYRNI